MSLNLIDVSLKEAFMAERAQLVRIARKILRNADLADEVVQDAFIRIAEGPCDRKVDRPVGYCCQIVRNLSLDYLRRRDREQDHVTREFDVELLEVACERSIERIVFEREAMVIVERVLLQMAPRKRQAFELHRMRGLTQRAIAQQMGCALGLVNAWIAEVGDAIGAQLSPLQGRV